MNRRSGIIGFVCCFAVVIYLLNQYIEVEKQRKDAVTVFTNDGKGMSFFHKMTESLPGVELQVYKRAFLYPEDLAKVDVVSIHSPKTGFSKKEIKTLTKWVKSGGKLFLSGHSLRSWAPIKPIMLGLEMSPPPIKEKEDFENFKYENLEVAQDSKLFQSYYKYAFYSPVYFADEECEEVEFSCHMRKVKVDQGEVLMMAGLPLHSNALIQLEGNKYFSFELTRWAPKILVDEFHHLFPSKSMSELLTDWKYSLPLLGLFFGSVLFFIFAKKPEGSVLEEKSKTKSLHDVGEGLIAKNLNDATVARSAHEMYRDYLLKEYPYYREQIIETKRLYASSDKDELKRLIYEAEPLIELHNELLKYKKGVRQHDIRATDSSAHL